MNIPLGIYHIENRFVELNVNIHDETQDGAVKFSIHVPLPSNYPLTKIGMSPNIQEEGLFYALISFIGDDKYGWIEKFALAQEILETNATYGVVLHAFYNIVKKYHIQQTFEESLIFRGFGKKILCLALRNILDYVNIDPQDTLILLEASGGTFDTSNIAYYMSLGRDNMLNVFKDSYPDYFNEMYSSSFQSEPDITIAESLAMTKSNEALIRYYKSFGFEQLSYTSEATFMGNLLSNVLEFCE